MVDTERKASKLSFSWQIIAVVATGILTLSIVSSLVASYVVNQKSSDLILNQAHQITGNLARQSILPLLSGVIESSNTELQAVLNYPNIKSIGLYDERLYLLMGVGDDLTNRIDLLPVDLKPFVAVLSSTTKDSWGFIAPVYDVELQNHEIGVLDELFAKPPSIIGYVKVVIDRSSLIQTQRSLARNILFISLAIAIVIIIVVVFVTRRMTKPIYTLAELMKRAEVGEDDIKADLNGPAEIYNMAHAFNAMMHSLALRRDESLIQKEQISNLLAKHEAMISTLPGVVYELDQNGCLIWWNKRVEEVTGLSADELYHRSAEDFFRNEDKEIVKDSILRASMEGKAELHIEFITKEGLIPYQFNSVHVVGMHGRESSLVGIGIDDSESIEIQQTLAHARDTALESTRLKSEFLANMSHEIRTPMNGMVGMLQLLSDSDLNDEQKSNIDIALRSSDQLLNIINDILDISKIEAGKLSLECAEFSPGVIIEDVVDLFSQQAQDKGVSIYSNISFDTSSFMLGDSGRFHQVLANIIGNSVKFTNHGHIVVSCAASTENNNEHKSVNLNINIKDTGIGIDEKSQSKIFESFVQADGSASRKYSGTGLGLSIVKHLTEMMGGNVSFKSEPGEGTCFDLSIPFLLPDEEEDLLIDLESFKDKRVAYIGDDSMMSSILNGYLKILKVEYQEFDGIDGFVNRQSDKTNYILVENKILESKQLSDIKALLKDGVCVFILMNKDEAITPDVLNLSADNCITRLNKPLKQNILCQSLLGNTEQLQSTLSRNVSSHTYKEFISEEKSSILVVEDNETNQRVMKTMLEKLGYNISFATNGQEAVALTDDMDFDLVLMDCQMPVMDGYEATRRIRKKEHGDTHLGIIAMTGNAMEGDREKCLNAGMDDYLAKPIRFRGLGEMISKWLSQASDQV